MPLPRRPPAWSPIASSWGAIGRLATVQLGVAELLASGTVRLVDGTLLSCANDAGCASHSEFAGWAAYGYCAAKSRWYWGMRLLLITDRRGAPVGYDLRPANEDEREGVYELAAGSPAASCSPTPAIAAVSIKRASAWPACSSSCPTGTDSASGRPRRSPRLVSAS